jgi:gliding motility-associated lipoprotein GldK
MEGIDGFDGFFLPEDEVFNNVRTWDVKKFKFSYLNSRVQEYLALIQQQRYKIENGLDGTIVFDLTNDEIAEIYDIKRNDYIKREILEVYPDTTVWITDFKYSYNEPMHNDYFWHDAYSTYPVVGVTWKQATAFCQWRTNTKNAYQRTKKKKSLVPKFRLPTEAEWEYAARGGLQSAMYPWGGPYTKNDRGCFMANFKPMRGDYAVDQALYTVEANAYDPNGYNLFNMAGNVSEWVNSSYEQDAYEYSASMNPNVNNPSNQKKIIRGGSWKDVKYFLQVSSRDYELENQPRSYIGFRTVHDYLGSDLTANAMTNTNTNKRNNKRSSIK